MRKEAIYPGTFDPITLGHVSVVKRGLLIFDKIVVAVAKETTKNPYFSLEERYEMVKEAFADETRIEVVKFDGLLVNFARSRGINTILRGLRTVSDFEYEFQMALTNRRLDKSIETVFIMAEDDVSYFSSSLVREIARLGGDISSLVPPNVVKLFNKGRAKNEG